MSATFKTQIASLAGSIPATLADADLDIILAEGCKDIIRRVELSNPKDLWLFTATTAVTNSGLSLDSGMVYDVVRGTKSCSQIPPTLRNKAKESDSLYYATGEFPVYYFIDQKLFIVPNPGAGTEQGVSAFSTYDSGNKTKVTTGSSNAFDKDDFVLFRQNTSTANKTYEGYYRVSEVVDTSNFIIDRNFTDVTATIGDYKVSEPSATATHISLPSTVDADTLAISNFPSSYYNYVTLYGAVAVLMKRLADLNDGLPTLIIPVSPTAPELSQQTQSLPSLTLPNDFIMPVPSEHSSIDFTEVPARPSYSLVPPPILGTLTFSVTDLTIGALALSTEPPVSPVDPSFDRGALDYTTLVRSKVPVYTKPVFSVPSFPTIPELSLPEAPVAPESPSYSSGSSSASGSDLPDYTPPVLNPPKWSTIDTLIEVDEDIELAATALQKVQAQIGELQGNISNELNVFNKEIAIYNKKVEESMANANSTVNKDNLEYQAKLSRFQGEVQRYQVETNNQITEWTKNYIENSFAKWNQEFTYNLQMYQADAANELNSFNRDVTEYQQEIQKATMDATNKMGSENTEYQAKIQKYQQELAVYQARVTNDVTEWNARIVQKAMTEFQQKRNDELQKFTQEEQLKIQKYQQDSNENNQAFQAELAAWNGEVTKSIQKFSAQSSADQADFSNRLQSETSRWTSDIQKAMEEAKNEMEKYQLEQQKVTEENSSKLQKFTQDLQSWNGKVQSALQEFDTNINKEAKRVEWITSKVTLLRQQYDVGFVNPSQQQQGEE